MPSTPETHRQVFRDATYEQQIRSITRDMEPRIRAAFLASMRDIKNRAQMGMLRDALRDQDIEAAINAMNIDPQAMANLQARIIETYGKTGVATINGQRWSYPDGTRAVVRWNALSPRAEEYARTVSGTLIQGITDETITNARETIADGYAFGRSTDRIARDLVGRIDATGRRTGGIVGLDRQSAKWVRNLAGYLDSDPKRALSMKLTERDKALIRKYGNKLTQAQIDGMLRRYENTLLMVRGRRIARTETRNAVEQGKYEAWRQGLEKTGVPERFLVRTWVHTGRALMDRPQHIAMNGDAVRGMQVPHVLPDGTVMLHPHDTTYGAGPEQVVNCECREDYKVDKAGLRAWHASTAA